MTEQMDAGFTCPDDAGDRVGPNRRVGQGWSIVCKEEVETVFSAGFQFPDDTWLYLVWRQWNCLLDAPNPGNAQTMPVVTMEIYNGTVAEAMESLVAVNRKCFLFRSALFSLQKRVVFVISGDKVDWAGNI
jgi:hypothetical protein